MQADENETQIQAQVPKISTTTILYQKNVVFFSVLYVMQSGTEFFWVQISVPNRTRSILI